MRRSITTRLTVLGVAATTATCVWSVPGEARSRQPDPELASHTAQAHAAHVRAVPASFPSTIDSDVDAYTVSPNFRSYFVVAGHLTMHLKSGSTTTYVGNLVDYDGNKSYPAVASTANSANPALRIASKNGTFTFAMDAYFGSDYYSGTGSSVPARLKQPASNVFFSSKHTSSASTYNYVLTQRVGPITPQFEMTGTVTFTYDANDRVSGGVITYTDSAGREVTTPLRGTGYFSTSYLYTVATINGHRFGLAATFSGNDFSGNAFGIDKQTIRHKTVRHHTKHRTTIIKKSIVSAPTLSQWAWSGTPV